MKVGSKYFYWGLKFFAHNFYYTLEQSNKNPEWDEFEYVWRNYPQFTVFSDVAQIPFDEFFHGLSEKKMMEEYHALATLMCEIMARRVTQSQILSIRYHHNQASSSYGFDDMGKSV